MLTPPHSQVHFPQTHSPPKRFATPNHHDPLPILCVELQPEAHFSGTLWPAGFWGCVDGCRGVAWLPCYCDGGEALLRSGCSACQGCGLGIRMGGQGGAVVDERLQQGGMGVGRDDAGWQVPEAMKAARAHGASRGGEDQQDRSNRHGML